MTLWWMGNLVLAVVVIPVVLAAMIWSTVQLRHTQAATGLLYLGVVAVLFGEFFSKFLLFAGVDALPALAERGQIERNVLAAQQGNAVGQSGQRLFWVQLQREWAVDWSEIRQQLTQPGRQGTAIALEREVGRPFGHEEAPGFS